MPRECLIRLPAPIFFIIIFSIYCVSAILAVQCSPTTGEWESETNNSIGELWLLLTIATAVHTHNLLLLSDVRDVERLNDRVGKLISSSSPPSLALASYSTSVSASVVYCRASEQASERCVCKYLVHHRGPPLLLASHLGHRQSSASNSISPICTGHWSLCVLHLSAHSHWESEPFILSSSEKDMSWLIRQLHRPPSPDI